MFQLSLKHIKRNLPAQHDIVSNRMLRLCAHFEKLLHCLITATKKKKVIINSVAEEQDTDQKSAKHT